MNKSTTYFRLISGNEEIIELTQTDAGLNLHTSAGDCFENLTQAEIQNFNDTVTIYNMIPLYRDGKNENPRIFKA